MSIRCSIHKQEYWCITSPTIELYNEITELQENQYSESKYHIKDKSGQNHKKERTFLILYLFYETIILSLSS